MRLVLKPTRVIAGGMSGFALAIGGYLGAATLSDIFFLKDTGILVVFFCECAIVFFAGALAARIAGIRTRAPWPLALLLAPGIHLIFLFLGVRAVYGELQRGIAEVIFSFPISIGLIGFSVAGIRSRFVIRDESNSAAAGDGGQHLAFTGARRA